MELQKFLNECKMNPNPVRLVGVHRVVDNDGTYEEFLDFVEQLNESK